MTRPKEPHFFAEDFYRHITTLEAYTALFGGVAENHIAIGEASVTYLASDVAARHIKEYSPEARLIAMVRNPIQMLPSLHSQLLVSLDEDEKDFSKAWSFQSERERGINIPKTCRSPKYLQYSAIGSLGFQVERLFQIFDRKQVKVIVFDDFVASTRDVYRDTLAFLGVPYDGRGYFPKINANKTTRSRKASRFFRRPPKLLVSPYLHTKKIFNFGSLRLLHRINTLNSQEVRRDEISPEMKLELIKTFRDDILLLSELLERDLTHWLKI